MTDCLTKINNRKRLDLIGICVLIPFYKLSTKTCLKSVALVKVHGTDIEKRTLTCAVARGNADFTELTITDEITQLKRKVLLQRSTNAVGVISDRD